MPIDGSMTFQIIIFSFMTVSLLLQYLNLYRSVWWLPHSYNNNAMVSTFCTLIMLKILDISWKILHRKYLFSTYYSKYYQYLFYTNWYLFSIYLELLPNWPHLDCIFDHNFVQRSIVDIYEKDVDSDLTKQLDSKFRYRYAKYFDVFGTFGVTSNVILHCPKTPFGEYLVPCLSVSTIFRPRQGNNNLLCQESRHKQSVFVWQVP